MASGRAFGCRDMVGPLRRVLLRAPHPAACGRWREYGWRSAPDPARLAAEHEALAAVLEGAGAEVVLAPALPDGGPDAIYVFDPVLVTERGAIVLRPGKELRRAEVGPAGAALEDAGIPTAAGLEAPALAEGGDFVRLDERTMLAGRGYRTSSDGIRAVARLLPGVELLAFDLPRWRGPAEVLHLLSLLSPLDRDLAVGYAPLLPTRLAQLLDEREIEVVDVPGEELATMGPNVLALAPRVALLPARNRGTRKRLERAGVEVLVYEDDELSKGDGGPTCLTLPLLRGQASGPEVTPAARRAGRRDAGAEERGSSAGASSSAPR